MVPTPLMWTCLLCLIVRVVLLQTRLSPGGVFGCRMVAGKIIAPKNWFGPDYADKDTSDLYCEGWEVI